jgi:hypothetical protein
MFWTLGFQHPQLLAQLWSSAASMHQVSWSGFQMWLTVQASSTSSCYFPLETRATDKNISETWGNIILASLSLPTYAGIMKIKATLCSDGLEVDLDFLWV